LDYAGLTAVFYPVGCLRLGLPIEEEVSMVFLVLCSSKHLVSLCLWQVEQPLLTESHTKREHHQMDFDLLLVCPERLQATHLVAQRSQTQADSLMHLADLSMDIQRQALQEVPAHS